MPKENEELTLETASKEDFTEVYKDMKTHFREDELRPYEKFIPLINDPKYTFLQIRHGDHKVGYMLLYPERESKFLWPEYFVIKKEFQSMGYGSKVLEILKSHFPDMNGLFLEIEHEDKASPNTTKRIKFYEKNGAKKLDIKYIHPTPGGGRPMYLFYLPIKKNLLPDREETLKVMKKAFEYLHSYIPNIKQIYKRIASS